MADERPVGAQTEDLRPGSRAWRKRVAVLVAISLAAAGLLLLERSPASAASAPRVTHLSHKAAPVDAQVSQVNSVTAQLKGAASVLTQTLPQLDATAKAQTAEVATSASDAAALSSKLAALAASKAPSAPAQASATAARLQGALAATQAQAAAAAARAPIQFCTFTIQIGPIIIDIPRLHIHIVIGPFFIRFRAPCFLSGRIPKHIP